MSSKLNMTTVGLKHPQLKQMIKLCAKKRRPLFIDGTTGVGKSYNVALAAREICQGMNRIFVDWADCRKEELVKLRAKPEDYYLFVDLRITQMDPSEFCTSWFSQESQMMESRPSAVFHYSALPGIAGMIFCDEINLAVPVMQAAAYQLIHDSKVGGTRISPDVYILGAGNRSTDLANIFDMAAPLKNRFCHVTLEVPSAEDWMYNYALPKNLDSRICAFLQSHPHMMMWDFEKDGSPEHAFYSPRSWDFCAQLIDGITDLSTVRMLSESAVGPGASLMLHGFLELSIKVDLQELLKDPTGMSKYNNAADLGMLWTICSSFVELAKKERKSEDMLKFIRVAPHMNADMAVAYLRMLLLTPVLKDKITPILTKHEDVRELMRKYVKYLIS